LVLIWGDDMDLRHAYGQIKILEIELRSYADEGYKVRYDFDRRLISWRDYYMWNNNFMKSITDAKMEILTKCLPGSKILEWVDDFRQGKYKEKNILKRPGKWTVTIEFEDETVKYSDEEKFPAEWIELRSIVESTTECSFRLH